MRSVQPGGSNPSRPVGNEGTRSCSRLLVTDRAGDCIDGSHELGARIVPCYSRCLVSRGVSPRVGLTVLSHDWQDKLDAFRASIVFNL
jgi:hypothetical protein